MSLTVATWNINSVRLRIDLVRRFLEEQQPDVLCLQETKCPQGQFPLKPLAELGYVHLAESGQKGYHGVAVVSRLPLHRIAMQGFCGKGDCRHVSVVVEGRKPLVIHNFYVPAGGDEPDPGINPKFAHKLSFLQEMEDFICGPGVPDDHHAMVVGDLNIAPHEHDVWSHKKLMKVVSHTPVETNAMKAMMARGHWVDVMRRQVPEAEKLYTWWSYRSRDWNGLDQGRRLDHVWANPALAENFAGMTVLRAARGWPQPSDHVPVIARFRR
jgi:exodeoxyribonuclease-3